MKETFDILFHITGIIALIGILGFPFCSLSMIGFFALKEAMSDCGFVWFTKGEAIFCGFFTVCTGAFLLMVIVRIVAGV